MVTRGLLYMYLTVLLVVTLLITASINATSYTSDSHAVQWLHWYGNYICFLYTIYKKLAGWTSYPFYLQILLGFLGGILAINYYQ